MRRRGTSESGDDRSLRRRITQPFSSQNEEEEAGPQLHQGRYGVYNGLTWDKLKGFLESKFPESKYPGLKFNQTRVCLPSLCETVDCSNSKRSKVDDYWIFETPEPLTVVSQSSSAQKIIRA
jgi:hypothetical protein